MPRSTTLATETIHILITLLDHWRTKEMAEKKITEASVLSLVAKDKISVSKGAQLLGLSVWDFYDLMTENGVALGDTPPAEIAGGVKKMQALLDKNIPKKVKAV